MYTEDTEDYYIFTRTITDDHGRHAENYMITRTVTDVHGRRGELYDHTENRGCPRRTFYSVSIEYPWTSVIFRVKNNIELFHGELLNHPYSVSIEYPWTSVIIRML